MDPMEGASGVEQALLRAAAASETPLSGSLELTPLCNMNCKMCYVRLSRAEQERLAPLRTAAEGSDNLMPYILDCARVYCTEGEICGELRKVFGEYRPMEVL